VRSVERDHAALAVLVEIGDAATERVDTGCGYWLGAMVEAMNDNDGKGVTLRNVRTWLAS
jgi:hypothetical protein